MHTLFFLIKASKPFFFLSLMDFYRVGTIL
jgi:hypothetical protein